MLQPQVSDLKNADQFQLLVELGHKELAPFIHEYYWKQKSWVTRLHYLISFALLAFWVGTGIQQNHSLDEWATKLGYAALSFFVLVPIHELLHGLVYKIAGATEISFHASLRQAYAYAIAHNFVANSQVFIWVALTPFLVINSLLSLGTIMLPQYAFYFLGVLLLHTAGTSGDFALLNYVWLHRHQELFTFDDALEKKTYFYASAEVSP